MGFPCQGYMNKRIEEIIKSLPPYIEYDLETGTLFNHISKKYEGIEGDMVIYDTYIDGEKVKVCGTIIGYTDHQLVKTKEYGAIVLSGDEGRTKKIIHK